MAKIKFCEERPELVEMCVNCTSPTCKGDCRMRRKLEAKLDIRDGLNENEVKYTTKDGKTVTILDLIAATGYRRPTINKYLENGMTVDDILYEVYK